ncbi:MAG: hypothetical protein HY874_08275 [Chloroflexi bacterium]|nr:hypothetical protein [Chloroflexota bacterium]
MNETHVTDPQPPADKESIVPETFQKTPNEAQMPDQQPPVDEEFVVLQTFEEAHGWPMKISGEELPPMPLPLAAIGRLVILPYRELLSWPRMLLLGVLAGRPRT